MLQVVSFSCLFSFWVRVLFLPAVVLDAYVHVALVLFCLSFVRRSLIFKGLLRAYHDLVAYNVAAILHRVATFDPVYVGLYSHLSFGNVNDGVPATGVIPTDAFGAWFPATFVLRYDRQVYAGEFGSNAAARSICAKGVFLRFELRRRCVHGAGRGRVVGEANLRRVVVGPTINAVRCLLGCQLGHFVSDHVHAVDRSEACFRLVVVHFLSGTIAAAFVVAQRVLHLRCKNQAANVVLFYRAPVVVGVKDCEANAPSLSRKREVNLVVTACAGVRDVAIAVASDDTPEYGFVVFGNGRKFKVCHYVVFCPLRSLANDGQGVFCHAFVNVYPRVAGLEGGAVAEVVRAVVGVPGRVLLNRDYPVERVG